MWSRVHGSRQPRAVPSLLLGEAVGEEMERINWVNEWWLMMVIEWLVMVKCQLFVIITGYIMVSDGYWWFILANYSSMVNGFNVGWLMVNNGMFWTMVSYEQRFITGTGNGSVVVSWHLETWGWASPGSSVGAPPWVTPARLRGDLKDHREGPAHRGHQLTSFLKDGDQLSKFSY